jgi:hypothetical protein
MNKVLQKPDLSGRLVNWAIELRQFDIEFHRFVKFCNVPGCELPKVATWVVYVDESSGNNRSGFKVTLSSPEGEKF